MTSDADHADTRGFFVGVFGPILIILAAAWILAAVGKQWFFDQEYPMWRAKTQMIANCQGGKTVIIGDSAAMAGLIPRRIGPDVVNLAVGGGSPIEIYYITRKLLNCPAPPKRIILSISPFHFMQSDVYWTRAVPFHFFSLRETEEVRTRSILLGDSSLYNASRLGAMLGMAKNYQYAFNFPYYYSGAMAKGLFITMKAKNDRAFRQTMDNLGYHSFGVQNGSFELAPIANLKQFKASPLLNDYYVETLKLIDSNQTPVVFVSMPVNNATYVTLPPAFKAQFEGYVCGLGAKYNYGVLGDILPVRPSSDFGDNTHLNPAGAAEWSDGFSKSLKHMKTFACPRSGLQS